MKFFILLPLLFFSACIPRARIVSSEDYMRSRESDIRLNDNLRHLKIIVKEAQFAERELYISGYIQNVSEEEMACLRSVDWSYGRVAINKKSTFPEMPKLVLLWENFCFKKHGGGWIPIFEDVDCRNVFWGQKARIQPRAKVPFILHLSFPAGFSPKDFEKSLFKLSYPMCSSQADLSPSCLLGSNEFSINPICKEK